MNNGIELNQLISHVAREIRIAQSNSTETGYDPILELKDCEMELQVKVEVEGSGKIKFWLLNLGAGASKEASHSVKLKFGPVATNPLQLPAIQPGKAKKPKRQKREKPTQK